MPSITPDKDQVEAFKSTRTKSVTPQNSSQESSSKNSPAQIEKQPKVRSSGLSKFSTLLTYMLIGGAGYWVYQQDIKTTALLSSSELRIAGLERQLSATGEEMGESAIEMKVRLETLGKTSDKLWDEMDKLWASAWRKNQSQILTLKKSHKTLNKQSAERNETLVATKSTLKELSEKQTSTEFSVDALKEKLENASKLSTQFKDLSLELSAIESNSQSRDKQQISLASRVTQLSELNKQLSIKVNTLEKKLAQAIKNIPAKTAPPPAAG